MIGRSKVIDVIVIILVILSFQLARIERMLQAVCRNQVTTAKLLGQAHGISVRDKKP